MRAELWAAWAPFWDLTKAYLVEKSPPNIVKLRWLASLFGPKRTKMVVIVKDPIMNSKFLIPSKCGATLRGCPGEELMTQRLDYIEEWLSSHEKLLEHLQSWPQQWGGAEHARAHVRVVRYEHVHQPCACEKLLHFAYPDEAAAEPAEVRITCQGAPPCVESATSRHARRHSNGSNIIDGFKGFDSDVEGADVGVPMREAIPRGDLRGEPTSSNARAFVERQTRQAAAGGMAEGSGGGSGGGSSSGSGGGRDGGGKGGDDDGGAVGGAGGPKLRGGKHQLANGSNEANGRNGPRKALGPKSKISTLDKHGQRRPEGQAQGHTSTANSANAANQHQHLQHEAVHTPARKQRQGRHWRHAGQAGKQQHLQQEQRRRRVQQAEGEEAVGGVEATGIVGVKEESRRELKLDDGRSWSRMRVRDKRTMADAKKVIQVHADRTGPVR